MGVNVLKNKLSFGDVDRIVYNPLKTMNTQSLQIYASNTIQKELEPIEIITVFISMTILNII